MDFLNEARKADKHFTMLIADDEKHLLENLYRTLRRYFKKTYTAEDGGKALRIYKRLKPDIILSDINMPAMDGIELASQIKALDPAQIIILMSARFSEKELIRAINMGIDAFLEKPIEADILTSLLEKNISLLKLRKDYTASVKAKEASDAHLKAIFEASNEAIVVANVQSGIIRNANPRTYRLLGYEEGELEGKHISFLHEPAAFPEIEKVFLSHSRGDDTVFNNIPFVTKSGERLLLNVGATKPFMLEDGEYIAGIFKQPTREEELETRVEEMDMLLSKVLNEVPIGFFWKDSKGIYRLCNKHCISFAGEESIQYVIGKEDAQLAILKHESDFHKRHDKMVFKKQSSVTKLLYRPKEEGKSEWYQITKIPLTNGIAGIIKDVTELKENEKRALIEKKQAQLETRERTLFFSNLSHDIRTPLNYIIGQIQLMLTQNHRNASDKKVLKSILESGDYLLGLLNELLEVSKIEMGKQELTLSVFDLRELLLHIKEIFKARALEKGLSFKFSGIPKRACHVRSDKRKLFQIIINLLGNAVNYTEKGRVECHITRLREDTVAFKIIDSGVGMDQQELEKVFTPFSPGAVSSSEGKGIGLYIVKSYLELFNSKLFVESTKQKGSRFTFDIELPRVAETDMESERSRQADRPVRIIKEGERFTILVADDEQKNRELLVRYLKDKKIGYILAGDGEEAVKAFRENRVDAVFMDVRMPNMDGAAASEKIKILDPKVPIFAFSAFSEEHVEKRFFDEFLPKPIDFNRLNSLMDARFETCLEPESEQKTTLSLFDSTRREEILDYAEKGNITMLQELIEALDDNGLRRKLMTHLVEFDMEGIRSSLM